MTFSVVSTLISERYNEIYGLLSHISSLERDSPTGREESNIVRVLRGQFYVQLYAAWEFSVTRTLVQSYSVINDTAVIHNHMEHILYSIVLDSDFKSIAGSSKTNWDRRFEMLEKQRCSEVARVDQQVFMADVQSLKVHVIKKIFKAYGINAPPTPKPAYMGLIDEVAERRSAVAHGRESAAAVGGQVRSDSLQRRVTALNETSYHVLTHIEELCAMRRFVRRGFRRQYLRHSQ